METPQERIIELNVGGVFYTVSRDTLLRLPNTMLEAMFSGRHQQQKHDGRYFIDRLRVSHRFSAFLTSP